jgi:predicted permease
VYGRGILAPLERTTVPSSESIGERIRRIANDPQTGRVLSPPVLGCLVGAFIGGTSLGRTLFIAKNSPLRCIFEAMKTLGSGYLPAVLLTLAGTLHGAMKKDQLGTSGCPPEGPRCSLMNRVGALALARFVLMPLCCLALLKLGTRLRLIPTDPLLHFVLLVESCMPSAQNSVVILNLEGKKEAAGSMAKTVSVLYIFSVIPVALLLSAIMTFTGL